ncbi:Proteinaceous RNase P 3 [Acorus calamus]|uniref:ribonuclease P n=1 Tax=Acorus calamus TaxID=4465 RepID=A0AAV9DFZ6_ACOCL|nr:Proteinaceous RNase P 3 [Acorus calamus]
MEAEQARKRKRRNPTRDGELRHALDMCARERDLAGAVLLNDSASADGAHLGPYHYNALLHICTSSLSDPKTGAAAVEFGLKVFDRMVEDGILTEAAVTSAARLAAASGDGDRAFELVRSMDRHGVSPRLRSYGPALSAFCSNSEAEKAYEVEAHMASKGVVPEEPEIAALLRVSADVGNGEKVYEYLVNRSNVDEEGFCVSCKERLVCVDIDQTETERFAEAVASLATERKAGSNFRVFQEWLDSHADYEAVVDGANIGYYQQNFAEGGFSLSQLDIVVKELRQRSKNKWPLVVLHNKNVKALMGKSPSNKILLEEWQREGALYASPKGSNDDWFWLYAAVKLKCLLVTNDEMRDHIFDLLGRNFFLKWKERHQVRYTFVKGILKLQMPPQYSLVIQESERGSWHFPLEEDCKDERSRSWLCITRKAPLEGNIKIERNTGSEQNMAKMAKAETGNCS